MGEDHLFDIAALAATLPETSDTMLRDLRLVDRAAASCRIFRVYRAVGLHFHESCDEYLYVLQGRAMFQVGDASAQEVGPGMLVHFPKRTVHGTPVLLEEPFVVLAIDTPRRPPEDVTFVEPGEGNAASFIATEPVERSGAAPKAKGGSDLSGSTALVRCVPSDTFETMRLRRELTELQQTLVSREQHLGEMRAQLVSFEGRYMRQVGLLHRQLDAWEQKIADLQGTVRVAEEDDVEVNAGLPEAALDPAELKDLFRELAKLLHPDFAVDAQDESRRTRLMALANDAYAREDAEAIRRMLVGYDTLGRNGSAAGRRSTAAHLRALIQQVRQDTVAVNLQIEELQHSGSAQLQVQVLDAARHGRDLLAEMAARVKGSIGLAMRQYELDLSRKQRPPKGFAVESLLSAEDTPVRRRF